MPQTEDSSRKKRIIFIALAAIIVIIIFVAVWMFLRSEEPAPEINTNAAANLNTETIVLNVNEDAETNVNAAPEPPEELDLTRLANFFAERFGSYSSDSRFQNTLDLKVYMTAKMKAWADQYVSSQSAEPMEADFVAVVTKVISTKINSQSETAAEVEMITQRTEEKSGISGKTSYYQNIIMELVKEGDGWLVDSALWGDKQ